MKINKIIIAEPSPIISSGLLKYLEDINQLNIVSIVAIPLNLDAVDL